MKERSKQPKRTFPRDEHPEVYSVSQDKDGSYHLSRRDFLYASTVIGGAFILRMACPRFDTNLTTSGSIQAGKSPLSGVYVHTKPSIASNIVETLKGDDLVRLVSDHPDLGWAEVGTRNGHQGWVKRDSLDYSRAIKSLSPSFGLSGTKTLARTNLQPQPQLTVSNMSLVAAARTGKVRLLEGAQDCGEAIQNGDFEAGDASWTEVTSGSIIRADWPDPYQGLWVACFGGIDADESLTQLFHVPDNVQDAQKVTFYVKVTTQETDEQVVDVFNLRFLDSGGNPISDDILMANNSTPMNWSYGWVDLNGMSSFAGQDLQIQFACVTNHTNETIFVLDLVSLNLVCDAAPVYYIFLPIVIKQATPTPSPTPTLSPTPCSSYCADCPSYCSSDCSSHTCDYDCSSVCPVTCIYYCPSDCSSHCYDWSW